MKFIPIILFVILGTALACTPSQSSFKSSADSAAIIVKKFKIADYSQAFGVDCSHLDLESIAQKIGSTAKYCGVIDEVFNTVAIQVTPAQESADCVKHTKSKPYSENVPFEIALNKNCEYTAHLKIGFVKAPSQTVWLLEGKQLITSQELSAAPDGKVAISANLVVTQDGQSFGFGPKGNVGEPGAGNPANAAGKTYKVSFKGSPFSGGKLTGEGMDCNQDTATICQKSYAAGSNLEFSMPTSVVSVSSGKTYDYAGSATCNGTAQKIAASGSVVKLKITNLSADMECNFAFVARESL